jgi:hypothetical protein
VTEVFDWDAAALLRGSHQRRLAVPEESAAGDPGPPASLDTPVGDLDKSARRRTSNRSLTDWE